MTGSITIQLWEVDDRDEYIDFHTAAPGGGGRMVRISRSIIEHISRGTPLPNGWRPCEVRLPEWLVVKEGL